MQTSYGIAAALLLAVALATGAPHPRTACGGEPAAPFTQTLADLTARDPATRVAAAQGVKYSGGGVRLAPVLADIAFEDPEATVRDAAAEAVERMAEVALVVWMRVLGEAAAGKSKEFGQVAEVLVQLGPKATAVDFAAGLAATAKDAEAAGVLGPAPLLVAWPGSADREASPGLDVLLDRRIETSRPRTSETASAMLALKAAAALRDRRTGAPGTLERPNLTVAEVSAVLAPGKGGKQPPGLAEVLYAVMGAVARPDTNALDLLAKAAPTAEHALAALARLGTYAASLAPELSQTVPLGTAGRAVLLTRLNRSEDAFPSKPHELKLAFEQKEGPPRETVTAFALESRALARRQPESARRAIPALLYIARGDFRTPRAERIAAIEALGRAGRLTPHANDLLRELAKKRRPPAEPGAAPKEDEDPEESADERVAGFAYVALLRNGPDPAREVDALAGVLADPRPTAWRDDLLDALATIGPRLGPVRSALVPMLDAKPRADAVAIATGLALVRALRRVPGADADQAAALQGVLASGDGAQATRDLKAKDLAKAFADLGARLTLGVEVRRATVDALGACGPVAAPHEKTLEALRVDQDLGLRWRVERALAAIRGG